MSYIVVGGRGGCPVDVNKLHNLLAIQLSFILLTQQVMKLVCNHIAYLLDKLIYGYRKCHPRSELT